MTERLRLYFATDLHGSDKCFRKFVNAGAAYSADALILGGDLAGKAIQGITRVSESRYRCSFRGASYELEEGPELQSLEQLIADQGYYPYRAEPGELEGRQADGSLDELFLELMRGRLSRWLSLADERLRPENRPVFWMLGNDDPPPLAGLLDQAPWGEHVEGRIVTVDGHELLSWGYSNVTPWNSYREMTEEQLRETLEPLCRDLQVPHRAIFNLHVPPYGTGLDDAPVLDRELRVQTAVGQVRFAPVGSRTVRDILQDVQPLVGLHGHIHESAGFRKLGRTIAINPGSDYGTGTLNGVLLTLDRDRVKAHQFVRG
jgi:Icc-related predicted phosphoesterase